MRTMLISSCLLLLISSSLQAADENQLTDEERAAGWQLLFNGEDFEGWKCNNGKSIATPVEEGCIVPFRSGGYIVIHEKQFSDFVLKCDVRFEDPRCNSGIFFRVEEPANPVHTGFEIQVMAGDQTGKHQMGAIYDLVSTTKNASNDIGEWNSFEIRCEGPMITVKLNGEQVSEINCDEFDKPGLCPDGQGHKYKLDGEPRAVKDFARSGYLGFQDHGHKVWYRNIKVLELDGDESE